MDIRCFISIEIPDEIKKNIAGKIKSIQDISTSVKWVPAENLHLTLKFLGSASEAALSGIKKALSDAVAPFKRFQIELYGTGVFPDIKHPRVVWLGIRDSDSLIRLAEAVESCLTGIGFEPEEKKFHPHLTIGRMREARFPSLRKAPPPSGADALIKGLTALKDEAFGKIEVAEISIIKSELSPKGSKYTLLADMPLRR